MNARSPDPAANPNARSASALYEQDYYLWLTETAQLLRAGPWREVDVPSLAEEIEDIGRSEKRAVESNTGIVLMHLLKYQSEVSVSARAPL